MSDLRLPDAGSKQERVLVVDDEAPLLDTVYQGLTLRGYLCETAKDAATALRQINEHYFNSIIIDISLPDMNGLQLAEEVKKLNPDITIIIMTGFINEFSYKDAMQAGARDFIKKPFTLQELVLRLQYAAMHEKLHKMSLRDKQTGS